MPDDSPKPANKPGEQLPSRSAFKKLKDCTNLREAFQTEELKSLITEAIPKFLDPQAMLRTWVQAASKSPLIYEADMRQALGAFQSLAFLGLQPNTHLNLAHIIPFKRKVWNPATRKRDIEKIEIQVIIGYPGYVELAHRSGAITSLHADVVYDVDAEGFSWEFGSNKHLTHRGRKHDNIVGPDADPLYAYCWFKMANGDDQFEVMPWYEVEAIRNRSQAYRQALANLDDAKTKGYRIPSSWSEAPWVRDKGEMGKKTVARRGMKWIPKSPELRAAAAMEDAQEHGDLDWGLVIDGDASPYDGVPNRGDRYDDEPQETQHSTGQVQSPLSSPRPPIAQESKKEPPKQTPPKVTDVPQEPSGPAFEAMLIDEFGEIASDTFTDPTAFARALVDHWRKMDKASTEEFLTQNSDAIHILGTQFPATSVIVNEIESPASATDHDGDGQAIDGESEEVEQGKAGYQPAPAMPLTGQDGKPDWRTYPSEIKIGLQSTAIEHLDIWADAQKETLAAAPAQFRLLAVKAISLAFGKDGLVPPQFLAEIIKPKAQQQPPKSDAPPPPVTTPDAKWAQEVTTPDAKWAQDHVSIIDQIVLDNEAATALREINAMGAEMTTKTVMRRLRTESADGNTESGRLFAMVDDHYGKTMTELKRQLPNGSGK